MDMGINRSEDRSPLEFMIADRVIEISAISEAIAIRHKQRINEENILRRNIK